MDKTYERIVALKNDIIRLKEKKASLEATLSTLMKERDNYIKELQGIPLDKIDDIIKENEQKIKEISSRISKIKEFLEKFIRQL